MKQMFFLLLFLLFSCANTETSQQNTKQDFQYGFNIKNKIVLPNENTYFYSFLTQVIDSNTIVRRKTHVEKYGIDIYDLKNNHKKSYPLSSDEIRELKKSRGFYYKNKDSILYFGINKILIKDKEGKIIYNHFFNPPANNNYFPIILTNGSPPFMQRNTVYFTKIIDMTPGERYYNTSNILGFNIVKDSLFELRNLTYPNIYRKKCFTSEDLNISYTLKGKDSLILNYPIDDNLYIYSLEKQKIIGYKKVRSTYKNQEVKNVDCGKIWNDKIYQKHHYTSTTYTDIVYDKYRKVYYRFVKLPKENYNLNEKFNSLNTPFSIMILDENFNIIGESEKLNTPPKYIHFDYFIHQDGLYLSANNPENPEYNEDKLIFELFTIEKNRK